MDAMNFDTEFNDMMSEIKNNISFIENELDLMLLSCWITKLSEPVCAIEEKARRNEYLSYLVYLLKRQTIHHPFVDQPPSGPLPPLNIDLRRARCQDDLADEAKYYSPERRARCQDDLADEAKYYSPEATLTSFNETPIGRMHCAAPAQQRSDVGSWPMHGPIASTPFPSRQTNRQGNTPIKRHSGESKLSPCSPCKNYNASKSERQRERLDEPTDPCSLNSAQPPPPVSPEGYLDTSIEVDDQPFMPPLPGSEKAKNEISRINESVNNCTRLSDFIRLIGPNTCDQGQMLNIVATAELAEFTEFVQSMYKTRMMDTEELLGREQLKLKERYEGWKAKVIMRAEAGIQNLQRTLPNFKYEMYERDPEYLYLLLRKQFSVKEDELNPQIRDVRIKAQKKRWLTDEAEKIEKENEDRKVELKELNEKLNQLSKCYNAKHKKYMKKNKHLEEKSAKLRIRFQQNQKLINFYIDRLNSEP